MILLKENNFQISKIAVLIKQLRKSFTGKHTPDIVSFIHFMHT